MVPQHAATTAMWLGMSAHPDGARVLKIVDVT